jgi:hypothetical protein
VNPAAIIAAISAVNNFLAAAAPLIAAVKTLREQHPDLDLPPTPTLDELADAFEGKRSDLLSRNAQWFAARHLDPTTGKPR